MGNLIPPRQKSGKWPFRILHATTPYELSSPRELSSRWCNIFRDACCKHSFGAILGAMFDACRFQNRFTTWQHCDTFACNKKQRIRVHYITYEFCLRKLILRFSILLFWISLAKPYLIYTTSPDFLKSTNNIIKHNDEGNIYERHLMTTSKSFYV